jgi:hypothetical protein
MRLAASPVLKFEPTNAAIHICGLVPVCSVVSVCTHYHYLYVIMFRFAIEHLVKIVCCPLYIYVSRYKVPNPNDHKETYTSSVSIV